MQLSTLNSLVESAVSGILRDSHSCDSIEGDRASDSQCASDTKRSQSYHAALIAKLARHIRENPRLLRNHMLALSALRNSFSREAIEKRRSLQLRFGIGLEGIVLGVTNECNLSCRYCYSDSGGGLRDRIPFEIGKAIIKEFDKELGVKLVALTGGEPFPIALDYAEDCPESFFFVYTNGTRIDSETAHRIRNCGNIIPALTYLGDPKSHKLIRGDCAYRKLREAIDHVRDQSVYWGVSVTISAANYAAVLSGELFEDISRLGPYFVRMMPFVPVGRQTSEELALGSEVRKMIGRAISAAQEAYSYIIYDYVNDRELGKRCMAGGRRYLYVSPDMKMTPCVFVDCGEKIIFDKESKKTNIIDLLVRSELMRRARSSGNEDEVCPLLGKSDWVDKIVSASGVFRNDRSAAT